MATNSQKVLAMAAGAGYSVALDNDSGWVNLLARAECYVRVVSSHNGDSIVAPGATPAPAAGAVANYIHLLAGETFIVDISKGFQSAAPSLSTDRMTHVLVWSVTGGSDLMINAH
jgi:hypothetical protein